MSAHRGHSGRFTRSLVLATAGLLAMGSFDAQASSRGRIGLPAGAAFIAEPQTVTFAHTGTSQSFTVPENTCFVTVDAYGAEGGRGQNTDERRADGGKGGRASAAIEVEPGEVLLVRVGGRGIGIQGGYNGGGNAGNASEDDAGGGGGASDVRRSPYDLTDRLIVAGGGGGGGADADGGGSTFANGGAGGGAEGRAGNGSSSTPPTSPGRGGTQTAGGARGSGDSTARAGTFGNGGRGGLGASGDDTGGGGGGGWYGGGGGAGENDDQRTDGGAGGGGGSGYGPAGVTFATGVRSGHGLVDITWQVGNCDDEISFDWTMPDRFGFDENGDGLMDYYPPTGSLEVEPEDWRVDFKDTSKATCDQSLWRKWFVNGEEVLSGAAEVIFYSRASCDFAYKFPGEGVYSVKLEIKDGSDNLVGAHTRHVTVQDWLIFAIGDSIASGEGVPELNVFQAGSAQWQSRRCHRSAHAGVAWAARQIELDDPRTSVTFVHLACSGAEILNGLLNGYNGIEPGGGEPAPPSQVEQIRQLAPTRQVDAILMSIGANDVRFGAITTFCALWSDCHTGLGGAMFAIGSQFLPGRYTELGAKLSGPSGVPGLPSRRVYLTEYADPTRFDDSSICGSELFATPGAHSDELLHDMPGSPVLGVSEAEAEWASNVMVAQLNQMGAAAAGNNGWSYIGGIMLDFRFHGYCAVGTWIVPYLASVSDQGNRDGTLHPNVLGHLVYAGRIVERLKVEFYSNGDLTQPRRPGQ